MSFVLFTFPFSVSAQDHFFYDIEPDHPAFAAVTALRNEGIINGFEDNTFRPDTLVNRAEALKILLLGSNIAGANKVAVNPFPDVEKDEWYAPFVAEAKRRGIVAGTAQGTFEPIRTLNQAEALKMLFLTNEITVDRVAKAPFANIAPNEWFAPFYAEAKTRFLFDDLPAEPSRDLTRGELVRLMYQFRLGAQAHNFSIGTMSYYGGRGDEVYTAAHRTWEFGTHALVRSLTNGQAVVVEINDRGPYAPFRNLDISKEGFAAIENPSVGVVRAETIPVSTDVPLGPIRTWCPFPSDRTLIARDTFSSITLDESLPTLFRKNEVFVVSGKAANVSEVTVFWQRKGGAKTFHVIPVVNGAFRGQILFSEAGDFELGILPGRSGSTNVLPIHVLDALCLQGEGEQASAVTNLKGEIRSGNYVLSWQGAADVRQLYRVLFTQKDKTLEFFVNGAREFTPPQTLFADFASGPAEVRIFAANLASAFSTDITSAFSASSKLDLTLSTHHFAVTDQGKLSNEALPNTFQLGKTATFSGTFRGKIRNEAAIIEPNGAVRELPLKQNGQTFTFPFTPDKVGTYIVEINADDGFALINTPLYAQGFVPLLPDYFDLQSREQETDAAVNLDRDRFLLGKMVNDARAQAGLSGVSSTQELQDLAQLRADDMAKRGYFSHTTPEGDNVCDFAVDFGVAPCPRENIAADVTITFAHEALMRSAIHRENILSEDAVSLGIGIAKDPEGGIIVVELFAPEAFQSAKINEYVQKTLTTVNAERSQDLQTDSALAKVAQDWAEKMAKEDFFAVTSPQGIKLQDQISAAGVSSSVGTSLYQYPNLEQFWNDLVTKKEESFLFENTWRTSGIGFSADKEGMISIVILLRS